MPSKIDALIESMGAFREAISNLKLRADEDRAVRAKEHQQNQDSIAELRQSQQKSMSELRQAAVERWDGTTLAIGKLGEELREHADAVKTMQPQLASLQLSWRKLATLASIGLVVLWLIGKAIGLGFEHAAGWVINKVMH